MNSLDMIKEFKKGCLNGKYWKCEECIKGFIPLLEKKLKEEQEVLK